ncbi:Uu.00g086320.m01.CDS01 [Anthostomella pinea]|uniref:Uu.00g086320.m01.CDS01 n=1 Tax=Anthostomella pinea TaxID=933095 RepID=A0AAI8VM27_9PEZI|nr:Uu.00g086320.m01.CDS01 [Anthostomella pinea]
MLLLGPFYFLLGASVVSDAALSNVNTDPKVDPNRNCQVDIHIYLHNITEGQDFFAITTNPKFLNGTQIVQATFRELQFFDAILDDTNRIFETGEFGANRDIMTISNENRSTVFLEFSGLRFFSDQNTGDLNAHCPLNTEFAYCGIGHDCNATEPGVFKTLDPVALAERDVQCIFPC